MYFHTFVRNHGAVAPGTEPSMSASFIRRISASDRFLFFFFLLLRRAICADVSLFLTKRKNSLALASFCKGKQCSHDIFQIKVKIK